MQLLTPRDELGAFKRKSPVGNRAIRIRGRRVTRHFVRRDTGATNVEV
jgi:hypothetical protein